MENKREGLKDIRTRFVFDRGEISQHGFEEHVVETLTRKLCEEFMEKLCAGSRVFDKIELRYDEYFDIGRNLSAISGSLNYRDFYFCKDCAYFCRDSANGGMCSKMRDIVHITDGCTLGKEKTPKR